jgi:predicted nucleic acid-binding protein
MDTISPDFARMFGQSVYIDTNVFIYFLDRSPTFLPVVAPFLRAVMDGRIIGYTGVAVIAETMVKPYKIGDVAIIGKFKDFFYQKDFLTILPHDPAIFDLASQISAKNSMKLIDSLHLATAVQGGCNYLITHDGGFKPMGGVEIVLLRNLVVDG